MALTARTVSRMTDVDGVPIVFGINLDGTVRIRWGNGTVGGADLDQDGCKEFARLLADALVVSTATFSKPADGGVMERLCESGCGCRYGTEDPDSRDCSCDGPCCEADHDVWFHGGGRCAGLGCVTQS